MTFAKGLNLTTSARGMTHAKSVGCNAIRVETHDGIATFSGESMAALHTRAQSYGLAVVPLVNDVVHGWTTQADRDWWTAQVLQALPYADLDRVEKINEPYGPWYEEGGTDGGHRPVGSSRDYDGMVRSYKQTADALVSAGSTVKLIHATEGKLPNIPGPGFSTDTMTVTLIKRYAAIFGGWFHGHAAFGGWALHIYTGDPNAFAKIADNAPNVWVTECGDNGQLTGPTPPLKEAAAITKIYAEGRKSTPTIQGAFYYNQDRAWNDTTWQISEALFNA